MAGAHSPQHLRTDHATEPLGIEPNPPRFSWSFGETASIEQEEYRIIVATTANGVSARSGDVWDSGWLGGGNQATTYEGGDLDPQTRYWWTVGCRLAGGTITWGEPTWFETGIVHWQATWIGPPSNPEQASPAPVYQRAFRVDGDIAAARLYIAVGGLYEASINDNRVGNNVLDTAVTDYEASVPYVTHDVTDLLRTGGNDIEVTAGRGRYALTTENTWGWHRAPWHASRPHLLAQIEISYSDGSALTIGTDGDWVVSDGPTTFDSIYEGDVYDARSVEGTHPEPVRCVDGPAGRLVPQTVEPMQVVETLEAVHIDEPKPGVYVFDFGEMTAGWASLEVNGSAGTEIVLRYGEKRADDGTVAMAQPHIEGDFQTDRYILGGDGSETWEPRFSYKGFQFVEVHGLSTPPTKETVRARVVHSTVDEAVTSEFSCEDELLTRIHENSRRSFLNNFHGIPTDTPAYEKNGWTGDVLVGAEAACYHFPMGRFFGKWLDDFGDAQRPDGEVPPIVPTSDFGYSHAPFGEGITSPNPGWDAAYLDVTWTTFMHTGDERLLENHYDGMHACVAYFERHAENGLLDAGLGDWLAPGHGRIRARPPEGTLISGTAYYYRVVDRLARTATILGRDGDATRYTDLRKEIRRAFNAAFLDRETGVYATGAVDEYRQTSNVLPLAFGLVPEASRERVVETLVRDVMETHDGHLNTGFHGTAYLLPVLTDAGHVDVAYTVASQDTYPSWGHWIAEHDATTHYEMWDLDARSRDHYAFGAIDAWFYGDLAGVRPAEPGFEHVAVSPSFPTDLNWVRARVQTVRGPITSAWERTGPDRIELRVALPGNTTGAIELPAVGPITIDGGVIEEADAVREVTRNSESIRCTVGPGAHTFRCSSHRR